MLYGKIGWHILRIEYFVQIRVHPKSTLKYGVSGRSSKNTKCFLSSILSIYSTLTHRGRYNDNENLDPKSIELRIDNFLSAWMCACLQPCMDTCVFESQARRDEDV